MADDEMMISAFPRDRNSEECQSLVDSFHGFFCPYKYVYGAFDVE